MRQIIVSMPRELVDALISLIKYYEVMIVKMNAEKEKNEFYGIAKIAWENFCDGRIHAYAEFIDHLKELLRPKKV